jgi:hypothetical protein
VFGFFVFVQCPPSHLTHPSLKLLSIEGIGFGGYPEQNLTTQRVVERSAHSRGEAPKITRLIEALHLSVVLSYENNFAPPCELVGG